MSQALSIPALAFAVILGTLLALALAHLCLVHTIDSGVRATLLGSSIGGFSMVLPGIWVSIFFGAPWVGGIAIGAAGEWASQFGAFVGVVVSLFFSVLFGCTTGAAVALVSCWVRHGRAAT